MVWIALVLLYGFLKGVREILKKKALTRNTVMEVLVMYTAISFVMVIPDAPRAFGLRAEQYVGIAFKSFVIFCAWICSFHAIEKMPISLYGILDLSRVLFSTLLGILVLGETLTLPRTIGLLLVCTGLLMLKKKPTAVESRKNEKNARFYVFIALLSCLLNGLSGTMDKVLMKNMTSGQLQFWYMFFLLLMYVGYVLLRKVPIRMRSVLRNPWIWCLSILFVIADRALFEANAMPDSKVTVMTLLKQCGCIVTIVGGKYVFGERNIRYKLLCATVVLAGIAVALL